MQQIIYHYTITFFYAIFLLKKNARSNIIKTILEYSSIIAPNYLKNEKQPSYQLDKNMNLQKKDKTIELNQKSLIEEKGYLWILGKPNTTTTKIKDLDTSIVIFINIQQITIENSKRKERLESTINVTK